MNRKMVIVIGAGIAGLEAAHVLSARGVETLVLEARERIGGRIHTLHDRSSALPIELGAEFVHGDVAETLEPLRAARAIVAEIADRHLLARGARLEKIDDFWSELEHFFKKMRVRGRDTSFEEALQSSRAGDERNRELAASFVEGFHAAALDEISARAVTTSSEGSSTQYRVLSGYDVLTQHLHSVALAGGAEFRLQRIVRVVEWSRRQVRVVAEHCGREETFDATAVIVTLPIPLLKRSTAAAPEFHPPLVSKESALDRILMGDVAKVTFEFEHDFWSDVIRKRSRSDEPLTFLHDAGSEVLTWWTMAPAKTSMLVGWSGGMRARTLLAVSAEERVSRFVGALAKTLRMSENEIFASLQRTWSHDWSADPFSGGAYSYAGVGGINAARDLAEPIEDTIFIAGEATSREQSGTVAGAIESGRRAAEQVLASTRA